MASPQQEKLLRIIPRVTGSLSILGSTFIIYDVVRTTWRERSKSNSKNKPGRVINRCLIGMSVCDILASFSNPVVLNLALPVEFGGKGNQATCNAQGFFGQFVTATALYSGIMALIYLLSIKYGWNEAQLRNRVERVAHALILSFVVASGTASIFLELYNPTPISCTMTAFPPGCGTIPGRPCIRGESASSWRLPFRTIPEYTTIAFAMIAMVLIYRAVGHIEARAKRWDSEEEFGTGATCSINSGALPSSTAPAAVLLERSGYMTTRRGLGNNEETEQSTCDSAGEMPPRSPIPPITGAIDCRMEISVKTSEVETIREEELKHNIPVQQVDKQACTAVSVPRCSTLTSGGELECMQLAERGGQDGNHADSAPSSQRKSTQSITRPQHAKNKKPGSSRLTREVGIQGICFVCAFVVTWTVPTIARCLMRFGGRKIGIEWIIAINFFLPLQGFFNFLVYLRPRMMALSPLKRRAGSSNDQRRSFDEES
mmetsp:Transcript_49449/g.75243  ORF Transcript_49449/g.75243 Transcript_49449/m.75243 type:complete len:487 (-) Transcript_49449:101-1561(-)